jgi:hypothetical protein
MKKIKTAKRLRLNCEILRSLQLSEVTGGGTILVPTKPQASCFIQCVTRNCPQTPQCPLATAVGC